MKSKSNGWRTAAEWAGYLLLFAAVIYFVPRYVLQRTIVDGSSMEYTLSDGDQLLVEKVSRYFGTYDRFDIVVFDPEYERANEEDFIKRIIGLPGETVQIIDGQIYINGEVLKEAYGTAPIQNAGIAGEPIVLGEKEYFVLGDNRPISMDSRSQVIGVVKHAQISGKVLLRIYPFSEFGTVE